LLRDPETGRWPAETSLALRIVPATGDRSAAATAVVSGVEGPRTARRRNQSGGAAAVARPGGAGSGELSEAQRRVAELAAAGLPNAAIAETLSITKRTVELHLSNVYRKLGIAGRAQLAGVLSSAAAQHSSLC
ncbi:helix-turn-helix transcriptional regulator, partial [Dactylosporangium fulvum]|uniref:helix-turn-helix domain-containing protein n=1 Tax=Dactylosporangium fulvum TaxID=53359 RepID=UPI0031DE862D